MIASLSSTVAISSLSRVSLSDNPSPSFVPSPKTAPPLRFFPLRALRSLTGHRLMTRLWPTEHLSVSEGATSNPDDEADQGNVSSNWSIARSYKKSGAVFEAKIEGFNNGGLLITFHSLIGFLPYTHLNQARFCKDAPKPILQRAKDLVGSVISVKVVHVNAEKNSLILSEIEANWFKYSSQVEVGSVFEGRVSAVEDYGGFVHLLFPDGQYHLTGLVHISEASWDLVQDMRNLYAVGDDVKVKVIKIDREKLRISLSIKQLEEDPLYERLDKVIMQPADDSTVSNANMEPLPGLDSICEELLKEDGIMDVKLGGQGLEKRVVSQDLELWLSNVPAKDNQFTLLARAGRQVQEVYLTTTLDQDGIKKAVQRILGRVP